MRIAITGAANGIGAASAALLKSRGAEIIAFDIVRPETAVDRYVSVDFSDMESIAATVDAAEGPFDALLNIAGVPPRDVNAAEVLAVNFIGFRAFTDRILPKLGDGGSIVNMASRAGEHWHQNIDQVRALMALGEDDDLPGFVESHAIDATRAYGLSKEAVIVWTLANTEALLVRGLRANAVSPSAVETRVLGDFKAALGRRADVSLQRTGRPGTAEEIAEVVAFLAGPESSWVKGSNIVVDGGISAMTAADTLRV